MYERFTENARQAIFFAREEASKVGSPYIEREHLLLAIVRSCEPELNEVLKLKELEGTLRADLLAGQQEATSPCGDIPLSNAVKRILAYAMEEAVRLNSPGIGSGHLLLGVLRESESVASRLLTAHNVDLPLARQIVAASRKGSDTGKSASSIGLASRIRRRYWIGSAGPLALMILLGLAVVNSKLAGLYLLVIAAIWFLAVLGWIKLGPSSFFLILGKQSRAKTAVIYAFGWLYQVFMFGWLLPLSVGIYRVTVR